MSDIPAHARAHDPGRWSGYDIPASDARDPGGHKIVGVLIDNDQEAGLREVGWFNARGVAAEVAALLDDGVDGMGRVGIELLRQSAVVFRTYEAHHRAYLGGPRPTDPEERDKHDDRVAKAEANRTIAERIERWLESGGDQVRAPSGEGWLAVSARVKPGGTSFDEQALYKALGGVFGEGTLLAAVCVAPDGGLTRGPSYHGQPIDDPHREDCDCERCWPIVHVSGDPRLVARAALDEGERRATSPHPMRRSIHRSHRGEGFNHID